MATAFVRSEDQFYYDDVTDWDERIMAPSDWSEVKCEDIDTCVSMCWEVSFQKEKGLLLGKFMMNLI